MKILNLLILTLVACAPIKQKGLSPKSAPPALQRQFESDYHQSIYDSFNFEYNYTDDPADARAFDAACYILDVDKDIVGSGILITPGVVLTAAHVAIHVDSGYIQFSKEDIYIPIEDLWLQPEWALSPAKSHDIALLKLECEVAEVTPIPIASKSTHLERYMANIFTVGCSLRYKKQSYPTVMFYYGTLITEVTELKLRSNTTSIWFGDSGGPVVKRGWNGSLVVVGVLASFTVFQGDLMDFSATDVRQYFEELNSVIKGWENQPQDSVLGVCSGNPQP